MIAGVDGCHAGWVVALADGWPCPRPPEFRICPTFRDLLDAAAGCPVIAVDMPIGLPSGAQPRRCDQIGRVMLGSTAASRLFHAPPRPALLARDPAEFQRMHRALTGRGAGYPVWGLVRKLRDVDSVMTPDVQGRVYEFHPELAWQNLAGQALLSKHTAGGIAQRQDLLRAYVPCLHEITQPRDALRRKHAALDDLLDALVGLCVAQAIAAGPDYSRCIPAGEPERDDHGLRMEIWS
jgi:predicted RNase H-like nuclease